jgi:hypothetical protein
MKSPLMEITIPLDADQAFKSNHQSTSTTKNRNMLHTILDVKSAKSRLWETIHDICP